MDGISQGEVRDICQREMDGISQGDEWYLSRRR